MMNKYDKLFKAAKTTRQVTMLYFRLYDRTKDDSKELKKLELAHERAYDKAYKAESNRANEVMRRGDGILFID